MKKVFCTTILIILFCSTCLAGSIVRVCDFGADNFCARYNEILKQIGGDKRQLIDKSSITTKSTETYDFYFLPINNLDGNGTNIMLLVNKEGYISEIGISNNLDQNRSFTGEVLCNTLLSIGLSFDDVKYFIDCIQNNQPAVKFIPALNRYVGIKFEPAAVTKKGFDVFRISAFAD